MLVPQELSVIFPFKRDMVKYFFPDNEASDFMKNYTQTHIFSKGEF